MINKREYQKDTENVNKGEHLKEPIIDNGKRPKATASDQAADDNDWFEKALDDDDTRNINSSEDKDERVIFLEFNEKNGMSNPQ